VQPNAHPQPIQIPTDWNDNALLTFEDFCLLIRIPQRTVRDWRRRRVRTPLRPAQRRRPHLHHRRRGASLAREHPMTTASSPKTDPSEQRKQSLLTITEAAAYLNVPARWVTDAVRQRKIRCTRIGTHVRFRPEHLDELIEAGEQPVLTPPQVLRSVGAARVHSGRCGL
jgi:excisionase family DNA binding protein